VDSVFSWVLGHWAERDEAMVYVHVELAGFAEDKGIYSNNADNCPKITG